MKKKCRQGGASGIGMLIILAIIGIGVYIALQYIPQVIEAGSVDTILNNLEDAHEDKRFSSTGSIRSAINRQLDVNDLNDLRDAFSIRDDLETFIVSVSYERELNLLYETKVIAHDKTITLRK